MLDKNIFYKNPATGRVDKGINWLKDFEERIDKNLTWLQWGGPSLKELVKLNGEWISFENAVNLMDEDLRDMLADYKFSSDQDFLNAYIIAHEIKFNEKFTI